MAPKLCLSIIISVIKPKKYKNNIVNNKYIVISIVPCLQEMSYSAVHGDWITLDLDMEWWRPRSLRSSAS